MAGYHPEFDIPVNPWRADYWSGASSSGSGVATAAGLCYASLGSDTGGSIRFPSMANGIVGLKPTYGRVSRYGVLPLAESLDHIGPMTRSVADAAVVFECIAGHDVRDSTTLDDPVPALVAGLDAGIEGMRIGIDVHPRSRRMSARPGSAFAAMKPSWPTRRISRHAQTNTGPTSATS
jgi:amidase